jgi:hypothetical protein
VRGSGGASDWRGSQGGLKPCEPWFGKDRMELERTLVRLGPNCRRRVREAIALTARPKECGSALAGMDVVPEPSS